MITFAKAMRLLAATACLGIVQAALAQQYPDRPLKIVNNWPAGGGTDTLARAVGAAMSDMLKQPVIVENRPGAGGNIGAEVVAKAPADGYTILFGIDSTFTINPHLYPKMGFDPASLKPLVVTSSSGLLVNAHPSTGWKTLGDLINAARKSRVTLATGGNGSPGHFAVAALEKQMQLDVEHIPYKGITGAINGVVGREVDGGILAASSVVTQLRAGKVVALAFTSNRRSELVPEVPTVAELGIKELEQKIYHVLMVPAATPPDIARRIEITVLQALQRPEVQAVFKRLDAQVEGLGQQEAARLFAQQSALKGAAVKATNMKVE